jgi:hypothetical protein
LCINFHDHTSYDEVMDLLIDEQQRRLAHHVLSRLILGQHPLTGRVLPPDSVLNEPDVMRALVVAFSCLPGVEPMPEAAAQRRPQLLAAPQQQWEMATAPRSASREILVPIGEEELREYVLQRRVNGPAVFTPAAQQQVSGYAVPAAYAVPASAAGQGYAPASMSAPQAANAVPVTFAAPVPLAASVVAAEPFVLRRKAAETTASPASVAAAASVQETPSRSAAPWSRREDEQLVDRCGSGENVEQMAAALERSASSVKARLKRFGLL